MEKDMEWCEAQIPIVSGDGVSSGLNLFRAEGGSCRPVVICFPAMGVPAKYYRYLARGLAESGIHAATADLRGIGSSSVRASRETDFSYFEMVRYDWPAIVNAVAKAFPGNRIFLMGHSLGGQLSSLFLSSQNAVDVTGLILVATNSVYYRSFGFPDCIRVYAGINAAFLVSQVVGYLPGHKLGFGGREARGVIRDWSGQGRTGRYKLRKSREDYEALLGRLTLPVLSISFEGDFLAPRGAARHLLGKMKQAHTTHFHLNPDDYGLKNNYHFSWARMPDFIIEKIMEWMDAPEK